ncbi:hypothetical protein GCM10009679_39930 [Saccharothrix algeriensis]|uniref:Uncharacterized protein n=1 Tax=Catellatospora bangladeshensis TaxID=310355 RepID=A0A8J3NHE5_9ACTN|nr:hypothetical protein Cba03nite_25110 [Catellatospora bangladeshensis]
MTELAEADLPSERLGPPAACATAAHPAVAIIAVASASATVLIGFFRLITVLFHRDGAPGRGCDRRGVHPAWWPGVPRTVSGTGRSTWCYVRGRIDRGREGTGGHRDEHRQVSGPAGELAQAVDKTKHRFVEILHYVGSNVTDVLPVRQHFGLHWYGGHPADRTVRVTPVRNS